MRTSLRILLAIFVIILLGMSATAVFEYTMQQRTLRQIAQKRDAVTISSVDVNLENSIVASRNLLQSYIELLPVGEVLNENLDETRKKSVHDKIIALMHRINSFSKIDVYLLLINAHGDIVASSLPQATSNRSKRDFFRRAISGESVLYGPFVALDINVPVYAIAEPVRNERGDITGVFAIFVPLSSLKDDIKELVPPDLDSQVLLINQEGKIVFNSTGKESDISENFYSGWLPKVMSANSGNMEIQIDGRDKLLSFEKNPHLHWCTVVISDMSGVLEQAAKNRDRIIAANAVSCLCIFIAILLATRSMGKTLRNCITLARQGLKENELPPAALDKSDDLSVLERVLQALVGDLARHREELEDIVRDRNQELIVAEQQLKLLLDSMPDALLSVTPSGEINFTNPAACKLLDYSADELLSGMNWSSICEDIGHHDEKNDEDELPGDLCGHFEGNNHVDMWLKRKGGARFLAELFTIPVHKDGLRIGFSLLFKDVTEARELQHRMDALYKASSGIYMITIGRELVDCSESCRQMLKINSASEFADDWQRFLPEFQPNGELSVTESDRHAALARENGLERFEWHFRAYDGTPVPCEITLTPVTAGGREALMVIIRDLGEIKKSETALDKERTQLQRILDSAPAGVFVISIDHIVRFANPAFIKLVRCGIGEPIDSGFINDEDKNIIISHVGKHGIIYNHNAQMFAPDTSIRSMLITATWVVYDGESAIMGWLVDITDIKSYEKELMLAKEQAEEATRTKGDFLARMSHEIRTPMNAIMGLSYLLKKTELTTRQFDFLEKIQRAADNLLGIIDDILDFSKMEANKMTIEYRPFPLSTILKDLENLFAYRAAQKGLEFLFRISPEIPENLFGDSLRISQILNNLCSNAIKFTAEGQIVVSIFPDNTRGLDDEKMLDKSMVLHFAVDDTGIGLSEDQSGKLFNSFTQADGSITRKYGGTGLGLAICKRLTELMGGKIWVVSAPGRGSTFHVLLRLGLPGEDEMPRQIVSPDIRQLRVLIVDDNPMAREILEETLLSFDIFPLGVSSGEEALTVLAEATVQKAPYQLVLLDWRMPGLDGLQTARLILERPDIITPPQILMVSGHDYDDCLQQGESLGLRYFLNKPVMPSTLLEAIYKALSGTDDNVPPPAPVHREDRIKYLREQVHGAHILLAEDNDINQNIAVDILGQLDLEIEVAENGREAVEMFEQKDFDLIFMDIQMPEMGGLEATRRIRQSGKENATSIPIIAMTANAMEGDYKKSIDAGMNGHITKPLDPNLLLETVGNWVKAL